VLDDLLIGLQKGAVEATDTRVAQKSLSWLQKIYNKMERFVEVIFENNIIKNEMTIHSVPGFLPRF
jgi:hypothetical protein